MKSRSRGGRARGAGKSAGGRPRAEGDLQLRGGGLHCRLDGRTGRIVELAQESPGDGRAGDVFAGGAGGPGGLEVFDELGRRWHTDLQDDSAISQVRTAPGEAEFVKQFRDAPFALRCRWRGGDDGLHLDVQAELFPRAARRSIRISLVLPVTPGLVSWAPSWPPPSDVRESPVRYCYLADEQGKARTGIPMLTLYHPGSGGLSVVMPFQTPKTQLNMGVEPADPRRWYVPERVPRINAGAEVDTVTPPEARDLGDRPVVRFTEKHVGLRPGKPLPFSLWLFGHEPDWRPALGAVVARYEDYFRPHPNALALAGGSYGANPSTVSADPLARVEGFGVTHAWFHGHFEFHGEFLTDAALDDPAYRWLCEPYPDRFRDLSVEGIRRQIAQLKAAGIATFLYGFNMHCDETIIDKRSLRADVARSDDGQVARSYHDQPVMFFEPLSPFGRQLLDQADRLVRAYPAITGLGLDNWNYAGIDFAHDDGITMVNHQPAANINFSQQRIIAALAERMHRAGRLIMTNKGRTIESMRGVDFVTTEATGARTFATFAYMNLMRNVVPTEYEAGQDPAYAEGVLKYLLVWGGQMGPFERQGDAEQARAYQPLLALLRNRRWVFSPDPLTLPEGTDGQVFRIDPASPFNPGAVMVTVVRPEVSWRAGEFRDGLSIRLRLPDGDRLSRAEWLGVERSAGPGAPGVACPIHPAGTELQVALPPVGAAGVLKLT